MKKTILMVVVFTALATACKKTDSSSTNSAILGKWYFVQTVSWYTQNGSSTTTKDTTNYAVGQTTNYDDFRSDGRVYSSGVNGSSTYNDTASYIVNGSTIYVTSNNGTKDTATISNISSNNLSFYLKKTTANYLHETWVRLTR